MPQTKLIWAQYITREYGSETSCVSSGVEVYAFSCMLPFASVCGSVYL